MARKKDPFSSARPSMEYLAHVGPHDVVGGELSEIGLRGLVFAPETAPRAPAVVLGHGYLQPVARYVDTLRFLASWGFVAAAPGTEAGIVPSHTGLSLDLSRALVRLADTKLNNGRVTVDPMRLGVMGHGIGGGAAVLAAAAEAPPVRATVTWFASPTFPSAVTAATGITTPGLHLVVSDTGVLEDAGNGEAIARAWDGPVQLRQVNGAHHLSVAEGKHFTSRLLAKRASRKVLRTVRMLTTAFFLLHVAGHDQLADEMDGVISGTVPMDLSGESVTS